MSEITLEEIADYVWKELPHQLIEETLLTREHLMQIMEIETEVMVQLGLYDEEGFEIEE